MKRFLKLSILSAAFALGLTAGALGLITTAMIADTPVETTASLPAERG